MSTVSSKDSPLNYLLLEGSDDVHVLASLLNYHQIIDNNYLNTKRFKSKNEHFDIQNKTGFENLLKVFEVEIKKSVPFRRYGVIIDADEGNLIPRWESVRHVLLRSGYDRNIVHKSPHAGGTIIKQDERPVVGVWIMPNNNDPGKIEDFVGLLRKPDDALWPIAEEIVERVILIDCRFPMVHKSKARIHTWLAWQKQPGRSMGQAITSRYVEPDAFPAQQLITWIRQLFELDSV